MLRLIQNGWDCKYRVAAAGITTAVREQTFCSPYRAWYFDSGEVSGVTLGACLSDVVEGFELESYVAGVLPVVAESSDMSGSLWLSDVLDLIAVKGGKEIDD